MRKFFLAVSALLILTGPLLGQSATLPQLDEATELGDDDLFLVRQDGETRDEKVTWANVRSSLQSALTLVLGPAWVSFSGSGHCFGDQP